MPNIDPISALEQRTQRISHDARLCTNWRSLRRRIHETREDAVSLLPVVRASDRPRIEAVLSQLAEARQMY
jgi:hypothetical protein